MRRIRIATMLASLLATAAAVGFTASAATAEPVTLHLWAAWDTAQADAIAAKQQIAQFEKDHPDIKIDIQVIAFEALHDKLVTSVAGGDAPDVSWGLIEWLGELRGMGALEDLTSRFNAWPDHDKIYPNAMAAVTAGGQVVALPNYLGLRALLYHADMLKQAGIASPPKTWDELLAASSTIEKATGKPGFGIAGTGVRSPQELLTFFAQNNVELAEKMPDGKYRNTWADKPEMMKAAAQVFGLYHRLTEQGAIPADGKTWGWQEEDTNFALGRYAMVIDGAWMRNRIAQNADTMKDVEMAPPPYQARPATFFEVNPFFVFKGKHPDAAWTFASFLLSHDYQAAVNPDRSPREDVIGDSKWGKSFTDLTPVGINYPPVALGAITRAMEESIGRVLLRNEAPTEVAAGLGKAINKALKQSGDISTD